MDHKQRTLDLEKSTPVSVLYIAFELANSNWKMACSDGSKLRLVTVTAGDLAQVQRAIIGAKRHFVMGNEVQTVSCYEAGRDGFWLHRYLQSCGIDNVVVDSASLEVNRRLRRAKTDRIDAGKLMSMLVRYHGGEKHLWRVVRVPSREDENARHLHRELEALKRERTRYRNRIHGILIQQGLRINNPSKKKFVKELELLRTWDGQELPSEMKVRLVRVHERLRMVEEQISSLVKEKTQRLKEENARMAQVAQLLRLPGIGPVSSRTFVMEFFGWRRFRNRREVAGLAGLTPTPYDSGRRLREQGISKAGNRRVRTLSIEIAWAWLRFQPRSKLSRWFLKRFADGGSRMRRIGIVALARRLLIDLWRFLEYGVVPEGAQIRPLAV
ncbi:MAG: IS110 family transposase [Deltaproteobacteria bacterium]|nr:IS110 family transposase [Deltaproteobacteria bacterium]